MKRTEMKIEANDTAYTLDKEDLVKLLSSKHTLGLFSAADKVRKIHLGNQVHLRGLIEFSSYCSGTCLYCGLRAANSKISRYRMGFDQILECARYAKECGLKTIVLQSGEDRATSIDVLCKIVSEIKNMDMAVTLSIGQRTRDEYKALKDAGADRYLLRIETSNAQLYEQFHPGMSHIDRINCLYDLKDLGYEVGTGCLIGLPGQTYEMLADDLLFFKKLDVDMLGMGPFIPCQDTPLEHNEGGKVDLVLRMMALARLLMPDINMPATTALAVKDRDGYKRGLSCGANVIMPNVGRLENRGKYTIYPGKGDGISNQENCIDDIKIIIYENGRSLGRGYGNRKGR